MQGLGEGEGEGARGGLCYDLVLNSFKVPPNLSGFLYNDFGFSDPGFA